MSKTDKSERKPLNPWARATYHEAETVKGACCNVWIKVPVPPGTTHVQPHVMGEAFAAGCRLEYATVNGEQRLVAAVKIGGITPSHVAVWAWEAE